jgi:hypothetical protein
MRTKGLRIAAAAALLFVVLYGVAGFVLVPKLLRSQLMKQIPATLGVTPAVGEIRFNPFLLQLELKDFSLAAPGGDPLIGFERLFVDFQLSSIWHRAYSFKTIEIAAPFVNAVVAQDGALNLLQMRPKTAAPAEPPKPDEKNAPLPALRIGAFNVTRGLVAYEDHSHPSAFAARLEPINFELQDFTTGVDGGRFTFSGASKLGERFEWHGHVSVQPIESDGEFQIDGLKVHTIWEYLEDRLNFVVNSGTLDLHATYRFALTDAVDLKAEVSKVAVRDLTVRPKASDTAKAPDTDWITVPALEVSGTTVDLLQRQAHVDALTISGMKLLTWLEPDGSINLLKLAAIASPATVIPATATATASTPAPPAAVPTGAPTAPAAPAAPAAAAAPGPPWKFDLREFAVKDAGISVEDRSTQPAVKLVLAPLSLQVEGASLDLGKPVRISFDTRVNETGSVSVRGDATPQPATADLAVKISGIDLAAVQPYVAQHTSMTLLGGHLGGDAKLHYATTKPGIRLTGNISVADLHTVDNALHDDFVNWQRLDLVGLNYQHDPDRLRIDEVKVSKPYARVIIEPDTSLNVTRVLAGPGATLVAPAAPGASSVTTATAPAGKGTAVRGNAHPGATAAAAGPAMPIEIKKILLNGGAANFADLSVAPNFSTGIQDIKGTVLGLSSKPASRATVDIHGAVDTFSPVSITGEVNVLSGALYTDIAMSFRNMELATFNPYSGKFAGYNITKGKLTTLLHYKVVGRQLDAQHHITVEQLEFGDKTASKDAVSLPIKLAVALLKDRNGVIDLDIPVTGTLDDPKFRLGPIIWKVFVNILEKAVTAPFALLGALFGGGPDLQFIDFQPGDGALSPAAADKLHAVAKAMNERPQLKIELPIATVPDLDRPALIEAQYQSQVHEALSNRGKIKGNGVGNGNGNGSGSGSGSGKKSPGAPDSFDQLDHAAQLDLLTQLYARKIGTAPKFPDALTAIKAEPDLIAAKEDFLSRELHAHITVGDAELTALGQQRAANLQQALLTGDTQIDPERVFVVANDKATKDQGKVRLELSLQ